ncbi:hypothetical protein ACFV3R_12520 [Streptomyces sp. NPDC059740]|uniref:hypothetical protein n=1 Tax=Streptomyces sp. NPDC059740 TaxID=3346926 RepID=UPI00365172EC
MPSNDARLLLTAALPTAGTGVIAVAVSAALAGGKGALGAVVGVLVAAVLMGSGMAGLQTTARKYPHLFQMMGPAMYVVQVLLMAVVLAVFRGTELFNPRAFGFSMLAATLVWITAQAWSYKRAKIMYIDPDAARNSA